MSTIQTNAIVDASGGNTTTVNGISPLANTARFARNIVINGDMKVAQRATTATVGPNGTGEGYTVVDRFLNSLNGTVVSTFTQSTDAPSGFAKSAKIEITTADNSLASTDFWHFRTSLEGQDLQHIGKGTSGAKSLTVSFWVKSNKTGCTPQNLKIPIILELAVCRTPSTVQMYGNISLLPSIQTPPAHLPIILIYPCE